MDGLIGQIVLIIILIIFSAYFSATETAFTSVNRIRMKNLAADGNRKAGKVLDLLEKYDKLLDVRGLGCMLGMVVDGDPTEIVDAFRDMGILALTAHGNVVRFLPTLSMSEKHLEEAVEMMGDALDGLYGGNEEE